MGLQQAGYGETVSAAGLSSDTSVDGDVQTNAVCFVMYFTFFS